jgi:MYXO-CTERM domain-containing protein
MGGTGGDGGTGGLYDGEPYVRHPKGCSCRTVGGSSPSSLFGLLAGLTVVGAAWRRRRWDIGA